MNIRDWQKEVHGNAVAKGWWKGADLVTSEGITRDAAEKLLMIVTEVAEATEDLRVGKMLTTENAGGKPVGFGSELADIVIRVFDLASALGYDLQDEIAKKHAFNKTRSYRHGGKAL